MQILYTLRPLLSYACILLVGLSSCHDICKTGGIYTICNEFKTNSSITLDNTNNLFSLMRRDDDIKFITSLEQFDRTAQSFISQVSNYTILEPYQIGCAVDYGQKPFYCYKRNGRDPIYRECTSQQMSVVKHPSKFLDYGLAPGVKLQRGISISNEVSITTGVSFEATGVINIGVSFSQSRTETRTVEKVYNFEFESKAGYLCYPYFKPFLVDYEVKLDRIFKFDDRTKYTDLNKGSSNTVCPRGAKGEPYEEFVYKQKVIRLTVDMISGLTLKSDEKDSDVNGLLACVYKKLV